MKTNYVKSKEETILIFHASDEKRRLCVRIAKKERKNVAKSIRPVTILTELKSQSSFIAIVIIITTAAAALTIQSTE